MNCFRNHSLEFALLISLFLILLAAWWSPFAEAANSAQEDILRLHILANSDGEEDQRLKLLVRDRLLREGESWFAQSDSKEESEVILRDRLPEIAALAEEELRQNGSSQSVKVSLCRSDFSTRVYEDFTLPAGTYDALRIELGSGQGRNWWCILFPGLCIPAAGEELPAELSLLQSQPCYEPRFFLWEICQKIQKRP